MSAAWWSALMRSVDAWVFDAADPAEMRAFVAALWGHQLGVYLETRTA